MPTTLHATPMPAAAPALNPEDSPAAAAVLVLAEVVLVVLAEVMLVEVVLVEICTG
jgi:hypothetical protein